MTLEGRNPIQTASQAEASRLKVFFRDVAPLEVTTLVDLAGKSDLEIVALLPRFTSMKDMKENPAFGLLAVHCLGQVFSLRSGLSPAVVQFVNGIPFKTGIMNREVADAAGGLWGNPLRPLGSHLEGQAAAIMRKGDIQGAVLYINLATPCLGLSGCKRNLPALLPQGASLIVCSKNGKRFSFTGIPD